MALDAVGEALREVTGSGHEHVARIASETSVPLEDSRSHGSRPTNVTVGWATKRKTRKSRLTSVPLTMKSSDRTKATTPRVARARSRASVQIRQRTSSRYSPDNHSAATQMSAQSRAACRRSRPMASSRVPIPPSRKRTVATAMNTATAITPSRSISPMRRVIRWRRIMVRRWYRAHMRCREIVAARAQTRVEPMNPRGGRVPGWGRSGDGVQIGCAHARR